MKHAFNVLAVLLLTAGAVHIAAADAAPQTSPAHASELREQMRALQQQQAMAEREQHSRAQVQLSEQPTHEGNADPVSSQTEAPVSGADESSRSGRMSPEERRALRRQINEAGHEIYSPSH